jgi:hypothetical protein
MRHGAFPVPRLRLWAASSLTELLGKGALTFRVDPKFPQAIGITNILKMVLAFGNSAWEVLRNPFEDSPFFTSDFPAAVEPSTDPRVVNRIVPLTPFLAVRLSPDIYLNRDELDFGFRTIPVSARGRSAAKSLARSTACLCDARKIWSSTGTTTHGSNRSSRSTLAIMWRRELRS